MKAAYKRALPGVTTGLETPYREGDTSREGILMQTILQSIRSLGAHARDEQVFKTVLLAF